MPSLSSPWNADQVRTIIMLMQSCLDHVHNRHKRAREQGVVRRKALRERETDFRRMGGAQRYPSPHPPALMDIAAPHHPTVLREAKRSKPAKRPYRRPRVPAGTTCPGVEPGARASVTARPALISGSHIL